jgi:hypothetical protein
VARNNLPTSLALPFDRLRTSDRLKERSMGKLFPGGSLKYFHTNNTAPSGVIGLFGNYLSAKLYIKNHAVAWFFLPQHIIDYGHIGASFGKA